LTSSHGLDMVNLENPDLPRAEGLDTLPKYLAERIDNLNGATT